MTKFNSKIKILISLVFVSILLIGYTTVFAATVAVTASVTSDSGVDWLTNAGANQDQLITFTDFQGELAPPNPEGYAPGLTQATDARTFILNVTNFALGFLGLIAVVIVIYGGYSMVVAAGGEASAKATKTIGYALVGLLIVMASFAIVNTVLNAPSGNENGNLSGSSTSNITTLRGVSAQSRFNYLAVRVQQIAQELRNTVNYHINLAVQIEKIQENLATYNISTCPGCSWTKGIYSALNGYKNAALSSATILENYASLSDVNTPALADQLNKAARILRQADQAYKIAEKMVTEAGCNGAGICSNPDIASEIFPAFNKQLIVEGKIDTTLDDLYKKNIKASMVIKEKDFNDEMLKIDTLLKGIATAMDLQIAANNKVKPAYTLNTASSFDTRPTFITNSVSVLKNLYTLADQLKNIKSVNAVITADIVEGNAPLIVNFSSVGSQDPSGLGITDAQIQWDLDGNGDGKTSDPCTAQGAIGSCTFDKPGTYRAILTVFPSASPDNLTGVNYNQEIAPGVAYIDIKVNPPSAKINLSLKAGPTTEDVLKYGNDGLISVDQAVVYSTIAEAKAGVEFNATKTTLSNGTDPLVTQTDAKIKWNFGTKSDFNDLLQIPSEGSLTLKQAFPGAGSYPIKFEVTDKNGITDRKIFTLVVTEVAPRISNAPTVSKIGQDIIFDGSNSTSDTPDIKFNWNISKITETSALPAQLWELAHAADVSSASIDASSKEKTANTDYFDCSLSNGKDDLLKCNFKKAGKYKIDLIIDDKQGKSYTESTYIKITSNKPQAGIKITQLSKSFPGVYKLIGDTVSFDPDETDNSNLEYSWEINPSNCDVIGDASKSSDTELINAVKDNTSINSCDQLKEFSKNAEPVVSFKEKGNYISNLIVRSTEEPDNPSLATEQAIPVTSLLDISWEDMKSSYLLKVEQNAEPKVPVTFKFRSNYAVSYEIEYGDNTSDSSDMNGEAEVTHNYTQAGKYQVKLTVFDQDNNENSLTKSIYIGDGKTPVAVITVKVNGNEVNPDTFNQSDDKSFENVIAVSRKDTVTFEGGKSINVDGTGRRLQYAWNINSGEKQSTARDIDYNFKTISDQPYTVSLKTTNEKDPTQSSLDSVKILVIGLLPTVRSITAVPEDNNLTTPANIKLNAIGATDPDGNIVQYKWWYYADTPGVIPSVDSRLGIQITTIPSATLTIGTRGLEGEKPKYKFGLEMTDNDNNVISTDAGDETHRLTANIPSIQVINGANKAPIAKFTANQTSVNINEPITFSSTSFDQDENGSIKEYRWDFGDGTKGENKATVTHIYKKANVDGYKVKLTVVDDNSSEATSDILKIFVDAVAEPPVAAFTTKTTVGSKDVQFTNTSTADNAAGAKLVKYSWDFNVNEDANGDGLKDNDIQSGDLNPTYTYPDFGIYRAKLTVTDDQGQSRSIINFINVKASEIKPITPTTSPTSSGLSTTVSPTTSTSGTSNTSTNASSAVKSAGANLFDASNKVDPGLLIASLLAYGILLLVARKNNKEKQNS